MRLGIDLDGVCYDFVGALKDYAIQEGFDPKTMPKPQCWDFPVDQWGWDWATFGAVFERGIKAGHVFHEPGPTRGTVRALERLRQDHEVIIVTHRSVKGAEAEAESATVKWLERYDVPHDELIITHDKVARVDLMLDDGPHNIKAALEAGEHAVVWDQAWNRPPYCSALTPRVKGWGEFERYVQGIL